MSGVVRNRTLNSMTVHTGWLYKFSKWYSSTMTVGQYTSCDDVVGNPEGVNALSLHRLYMQTPVLNAVWRNSSGVVTQEMRDYPMGYKAIGPPLPSVVWADPDSGELQDIGWTVLAKCNPGRSHVNVPQQLGELKDLPDLIRGWGQSALHSIAKGYLSWRWGVKPMISDVSKMLKFVESANKRFKELRRLRDVGYIKKRCNLGTDVHSNAPYDVLLHSNGFLCDGVRQDHFTRKRWGSVNWKVQSDSQLLDMEDRELMKFTRSTMLGLNSAGALEAAWELVPWSWFADWFSNFGEIITASNNAVGCTWSRPCCMQTSTSTSDIQVAGDEPSWKSSIMSGPYDYRRVHKARFPAVPIIPFPTPYLPVISHRHWSILASLAALRLKA
jgi:hypothetical protein